MQKGFRFRIFPTRKQKAVFVKTLDICRELYNAGLQERRDAYRTHNKTIDCYSQVTQLPDIKKDRPELCGVYAQVLQDSLRRLDFSFRRFFQRVKAGDKPGYPRFLPSNRYNSFTYTQLGFKIRPNGKLYLCKIGEIKIKLHRNIGGQIKTCTIIRVSTGKWFACFSVEADETMQSTESVAVGIDAGLKSFAVLSDGSQIEAPRFFRKEEVELARVRRKFSAAPKRSKERKHRRKIAARVHERIANKRRDFAHRESRKIINKFGVVCVEGLKIANMTQNHCLAKSITDAAWGLFFNYLSYKAEWAGKAFVKVKPEYTSQDCHKCGHRKADLKLSDRIYQCSNLKCGISINRDLNAALNILRLGLQSLRALPKKAALPR